MAESCVAVHLVVRPIDFGWQLGSYIVHMRAYILDVVHGGEDTYGESGQVEPQG